MSRLNGWIENIFSFLSIFSKIITIKLQQCRKIYKGYKIACYTMKQKISITIEEGTIEFLDEVVNEGRFRSKSHAVEFSINKTLREKEQNA